MAIILLSVKDNYFLLMLRPDALYDVCHTNLKHIKCRWHQRLPILVKLMPAYDTPPKAGNILCSFINIGQDKFS